MNLDFSVISHGKDSTSASHVGTVSACSKVNNFSETMLGLDLVGYGCNHSNGTANFQYSDMSNQDDGCRLVLGLGPTPNLYSAPYNPTVVSKTKESSAIQFGQTFPGTDIAALQLGLSRGNTETGLALTESNDLIKSPRCGKRLPVISVVDEGSTSAKRKSGGYMPTLLFAPRLETVGVSTASETHDLLDAGIDESIHRLSGHCDDIGKHHQFAFEHSITITTSVGATNDTMSVGTSDDQKSHQHHPKKCRFKGCSKGARGASGLCIAHGGGQRCQKPGCNKGAESRTAYCKAHGGGRRCQELGCTKSAEGKTDFCIAHGGGRRCGNPGCTKAARGKSGLCIRHGGGKRCTVDGCARSAEGQKGLCIFHGGGRRCQYAECGKGAQGSTMYCKAHGGGKRCIFEGCNKGAEGSTPLCKGHGGGKRCLFEGGGMCPKSVHGGTNFCVAHGGGKRCAMPGCTKSARGRTDCCVRHGGGKRCKFEGCGKSAQGSTDFCKAHGGGKRCTWATGCEKFARGKSGLCAAHSSLIVSQQRRGSGKESSMIGPGLFRGIVSASTTAGSSMDNENSSSGVSTLSDCVESSQSVGRKQQPLIPPQVLVPNSMKFPSSGQMSESREGARSHDMNFGFVIPEGRVHGGGLMSLLGGSLKNIDSGGK